MEHSTNTFSYGPLDPIIREIRLVTIFPAKDASANICCDLKRAALDINPAYEALSYVWGDPATRLPITICELQFLVTRNLFAALRYIRAQNRPRTFWIDAICIDQTNITERNHQVSQMQEIYGRASTVIAWLGHNDTDDWSISILKRLHSAMYMEDDIEKIDMTPDRAIIKQPKLVSSAPECTECTEWLQSVNPDISLSKHRQILAAGTSIIGNPWFTRAWVIQEVTNPGPVNFLLGKMEMSFQRLFDLVHSFRVWFHLWTTLRFASKNDSDQLSAILKEEWAKSSINDPWDDDNFPDGGKTLQDMWRIKSMAVRFPGRVASHFDPPLQALSGIGCKNLESFYWANLAQHEGPLACKSRAEREELLSHLKSYVAVSRPIGRMQDPDQKEEQAMSSIDIDELASILIAFHDSLVSRPSNKPFEDSLAKRVVESTQCLSNPPSRLCPRWPVDILMSQFRRQKVTDPRDKIFSLLGMASLVDNIIVDYSQTADQLYLQVATAILYANSWIHISYLLLFVECGDPPEFSASRPSWVPCWSEKETRNGKACWSNWYKFYCSAKARLDAGADDQEMSEIREERRLNVTGNQPCTGDLTTADNFSGVEVRAGGTLPLLGYAIGMIEWNKRHLSQMSLAFSANLVRVSDDHGILGNSEEDKELKGLAWAPLWAEVGDTVIIMKGATFPLVLHPYRDSWLFVGLCRFCVYCHDMVEKEYRNRTTNYHPIMYRKSWAEINSRVELQKFDLV